MMNAETKTIAVANSLVQTAENLTTLAKELPKKNRFWFKRDYSRGRSRREKKKRNFIYAKMSIASVMGAMQIAIIKSQPIPKFKPGAQV